MQQQQEREASGAASNAPNGGPSNKRTSTEIATGVASQQQQYQQHRTSYDYTDEESSTGYDTRSSEEYEHEHTYQAQTGRANGVSHSLDNGGRGGSRGNYSVAGTHDYLGYPKGQQPFDSQGGLWDDEEKRELW